jgi:hypothetical protein
METFMILAGDKRYPVDEQTAIVVIQQIENQQLVAFSYRSPNRIDPRVVDVFAHWSAVRVECTRDESQPPITANMKTTGQKYYG